MCIETGEALVFACRQTSTVQRANHCEAPLFFFFFFPPQHLPAPVTRHHHPVHQQHHLAEALICTGDRWPYVNNLKLKLDQAPLSASHRTLFLLSLRHPPLQEFFLSLLLV